MLFASTIVYVFLVSTVGFVGVSVKLIIDLASAERFYV